VSAVRAEITMTTRSGRCAGVSLQLPGRDQKIAPVRIVLGAILE
jgi:hypothetical protein